MQVVVDIPEFVDIPTSELWKLYGTGKIIASYRNVIVVDFAGHIGKFTVSKHVINGVKK